MLWYNDWMNYSDFIKGRYRILLRFLFAICLVVFDGFRILINPVTIMVDTIRWMRSRYLFTKHFIKHDKRYVLQQYRV